MNQLSETIEKNPELDAAEDFYRLRREGIGFIEQMSGLVWTDYNVHDPGITSLEALCYAITDLAYRIGWDIKDILAMPTKPSDLSQPYGRQAFFTARHILTVNPLTTNDFRRLLIDLEWVRNAWLLCKTCACETSYYAWCDRDKLRLSYKKEDDQAMQVYAQGLYDVLLELEATPSLGDLNDRKVEQKLSLLDQEKRYALTLELRFPDITLDRREEWNLFLNSDDAFNNLNGKSIEVELSQFGVTKDYDIFSDPLLDEAGRDAYLRRHWREVFYMILSITIKPSNKTIQFEFATLRIFAGNQAKALSSANTVRDWLVDKLAAGFVQRYRLKAKATQSAINSAKTALLAQRNLDEDYCVVKVAGVEEVAVCADVELKADADIEWVQAMIWFKIEQYFSAPIPFYSLNDLRDSDMPVENIFNGPALESGFIKDETLQAAELKTWLRVSDIVNELMDIDGVIAVNQLQLTKYDTEGNAIAGAADPSWHDGLPSFEAAKISASWLLRVSPQHQPRLYLNFSRFLFYKNGLPFLPRMDEANDNLTQLRGQNDRPKNPGAKEDLSIPLGSYRNPEDYYPVQYSFPLAYGIGVHGLPDNATALRQAQAKQMKAYLMVFEQLLGNAFAQLAHTRDLFSIDPEISQTYFVKAFSQDLIVGFNDIASGLTKESVEVMLESHNEFLLRRNRFLDHLLARFAEQFAEYALLLSRRAANKQQALERLISDKTAFLSAYPTISHDRAKAFNYALPWPYADSDIDQLNEPGIKQRIGLLLGVPDLHIVWTVQSQSGKFRFYFELVDGNAKAWFEGSLLLTSKSKAAARKILLGRMSDLANYRIVADAMPNSPPYRLQLMAANNTDVLGQHAEPLATTTDAQLLLEELVIWGAHQRVIVVEHVLLRPKFPGDALYPACVEGVCKLCGDEDPYSFRLTFVMPGWSIPYADDLEMRRFAERTIQRETPSHLLAKTCWVGNEGLVANPCDQIIDELADTIIDDSPETTEEQACDCAKKIYSAFGAVFETWYEQTAPDSIPASVIEALFNDKQQFIDALAESGCVDILNASWDNIYGMMVAHFEEAAIHGLQFDRFEDAWERWLTANANIDWSEERLQERLQSVLQANKMPGEQSEQSICQCAVSILNEYGAQFFEWMQDNLIQGQLRQFKTFSPSFDACSGVKLPTSTIAAVKKMLNARYKQFAEASYLLFLVMQRLAALRSIYPGATLHDCDEGNDETPVRLDNTALGNYKLRTPDN